MRDSLAHGRRQGGNNPPTAILDTSLEGGSGACRGGVDACLAARRTFRAGMYDELASCMLGP